MNWQKIIVIMHLILLMGILNEILGNLGQHKFEIGVNISKFNNASLTKGQTLV